MSNTSVDVGVTGYCYWRPRSCPQFRDQRGPPASLTSPASAPLASWSAMLPPRGRDHHGSGSTIALGPTSSVAFTSWCAGLVVTHHQILIRILVLARDIDPANASAFGRIPNAAITAGQLHAHKE